MHKPAHKNAKTLYRPLNKDRGEIRLIVLQPGSFHDPVKANIIHASLHSHPTYEALSYARGRPHITTTVRLSHQPPEHHEFQATTNLKPALRHLRYKDRVRTLWADAICINQEDDHGKASQIARMGKIYRQAENKCLWFGPEADGSNMAMDVINFYGEASEEEKNEILKNEKWDQHWRAVVPLMSMYDLDRVIRQRFPVWGVPEDKWKAWDRGHDNVTELNNPLTSMKKHGYLPLSNLLVILSKK
ncbi:hypothetical protein G7Y89_g13670 [Cudoniella acicularis]|uniref:Heterokaryon incompatibility domain-containing protein n=1 Tax=Cudoniella acicularis TaxID=354080 RepID=A0A8H4R9D6_9HELO|nr:hypothetical protein G7Y89_g13670 [Cudoniella acicularis]